MIIGLFGIFFFLPYINTDKLVKSDYEKIIFVIFVVFITIFLYLFSSWLWERELRRRAEQENKMLELDIIKFFALKDQD